MDFVCDGEHSRRRLTLCFAGAFLLAVGCARKPEPAYSLQEKTKKLPERQQKQIQESLLRFFGTPLHPRMLLPKETPAEGAPADGASEGSTGEASEPEFINAVDPAQLARGAVVFNDRCAGCHGATGDGNGEAAPFLQPRPRDYRSGVFKFTSTPYGAKPHRQDLERIIRKGAKGTSMPSFALLSDEDISAVVDYVIMLAYRGELEQKVAMTAEIDLGPDVDLALADFLDAIDGIHSQWEQSANQIVMPLTPQPARTAETIAKGRQAFITRGCSKCHGESGKGQTEWLSSEFLAQQAALPEDQRPQINYDAWGNVAPAADLTAGMLHGGRRRIDIYRRIYNGINGTPMPSFAQALAEEPETIWHLVHYVTSVVEGQSIEPADASTAVTALDAPRSPKALAPVLSGYEVQTVASAKTAKFVPVKSASFPLPEVSFLDFDPPGGRVDPALPLINASQKPAERNWIRCTSARRLMDRTRHE